MGYFLKSLLGSRQVVRYKVAGIGVRATRRVAGVYQVVCCRKIAPLRDEEGACWLQK